MSNYNQRYFNKATTKEAGIFAKYADFLRLAGLKLKRINICDFGCATGNFISEVGQENNCWGVDSSEYAILECKKRFPLIKNHFAVFDLNRETKLPFRKKFDLITMFDVIEHLDNLAGLKTLLSNSLDKNKYLLITTPNANNFLRFINRKWFTGEMDANHQNLFTPYTLDFFLRRAGYKKISIFTPYNFYFTNSWLTNKLLFGGQIFALYKKRK